MPDDETDFVSSLAARRRMIAEQIEPRGIGQPRVLSAIEAVPREIFVPPASRSKAYEDRALAIDSEQTISQPFIVAFMTNLLAVEPEHKVLEIGTGSGYQTAILARLSNHIFTIERIESLSQQARDRLNRLGTRAVRFRVGDGSLGWLEEAPFDRIVVTAAAPRLPQPLIDQLAPGGRLVIPVGNEKLQTLSVVTRSKGRTIERPTIPCRFVKFIGTAAWE